MSAPLVLLGAGASCDAGIPTSAQITHELLKALREGDRAAANLYSYIHAELLNWKVKDRTFDVNFETVFALAHQIIGFEENPISVFSQLGEVRALALDYRRAKQAGGSRLISFEKALSACLELKGDGSYIDPLLRYLSNIGRTIVTLNFDLLVETRLDHLEVEYDCGLSEISNMQFYPYGMDKYNSIVFDEEKFNLIKLHGSINWYNEFSRIRTEPYEETRPRVMLFGDGMAKVDPSGPFIELRQQFVDRLMKTNTLGIIGYSFGDQYVNAIIKTWMNAKKVSYKKFGKFGAGKLIVLNPVFNSTVGQSYFTGRYKEKFIDAVHIAGTAKSGIHSFIAEIDQAPDVGLKQYSEPTGWRTVEPLIG